MLYFGLIFTSQLHINMKRTFSFVLNTAFIVFLFTACSPYYYTPNTQNVPLIKEKGGAFISVAGADSQLEFQGAYGLTDNLAVQINTGFVLPNDEENGDGGTGKLFEGGIGYYQNLNESFLLDVYALAGFGTVENHFPSTVPVWPGTTGDISARLLRYGLQPSLSFHKNYFSVSASTRMTRLRYSNVEGNIIFGNQDQVVYLNENKSHFLIEPALTIRGGLKRIKLQVQLIKSFNVSNSDFKQAVGQITGGLVFQL